MSLRINDFEVPARALSPAPSFPVSSFIVPTQASIPLECAQFFTPGLESSESSSSLYSRPCNPDSAGFGTVREVVSRHSECINV